MTKKYIAVIYEGEKTEKQILNNINRVFFKENEELIPIMFPAGENIYMLWKQLKDDNFETDIIEILRDYSEEAKKVLDGYQRDDFMEVYLFFDYDGHNNNLSKLEDSVDVIENMLETFSEETEFGKLYINYPMVESLRDNFPPNKEICFRRCTIDINELNHYKRVVHEMKEYQDFRKLTCQKWSELCINSICKLNCIVTGRYEIPDRKSFLNTMGQKPLYEKQKEKYLLNNKIAIINSFPLFLLEYFKMEFWKRMIPILSIYALEEGKSWTIEKL